LLLAGAALLAFASTAFPQSERQRRIAYLSPRPRDGAVGGLEILRAAFMDLGYVEGRNYSLDIRFAENKPERMGALASELVKLQPDVLMTASSAGVAACKKATSSIPIVFVTAGYPVEQGFVSSLHHPGGNITGIMLHDLTPKMVEAARQTFPHLRRLAMLVHESDQARTPSVEAFTQAVKRFNIEPVIVSVTQTSDLPRVFQELRSRKAEALVLPDLSFHRQHGGELAALAVKARIPLLSTIQETAGSGGLLTYATSLDENIRRAAALVDKILKGAKPGDLPIEQPDRFQLTVNRKTAKLIGVELPAAIILRADKVID
jgi:putative ABC transport system substrate-binding protein